MTRRAWVLGALLGAAGCLPFDQRLEDCDAGRGLCAADAAVGVDAGADADAGPDSWDAGGCPGFETNQWCWVNPAPSGNDLQVVHAPAADDVWVGGQGGLVAHFDGRHWADRTVPSALLDIDPSRGVMVGLAGFGDGGVVVLSGAGALSVWSPGGWSSVTPAAQNTYFSLGVSRWGQFAATVDLSSGPSVLRGDLSQPGNAALLIRLPGVVEHAERALSIAGTENFAVTGRVGTHDVLVLPDGGVVTLYAVASDGPPHTHAAWTGPTGSGALPSVWAAGSAGHVASVDLEAGSARSLASPPATPYFHAGQWASGLGKHVLVGSEGAIVEGTSAQLLDAVQFPSFAPIANDPPHYGVDLYDVTVTPSGDRGLIVGSGGMMFERSKDGWAYDGGPLRAVIHDAVPIDGGLLVVGEQALVATVGPGGPLAVHTQANAQVWLAMAQVGSATWVVGEHGMACLLEAGECLHPVRIDRAPPDGGARDLRSIATTPAGNTWAVGSDGVLLQLMRDGGWEDHSFQNSAVPTYFLAVAEDETVVVFSEAPEPDGGILRGVCRAPANSDVTCVTSDLDFTPVGAAAALQPDAGIWVAGAVSTDTGLVHLTRGQRDDAIAFSPGTLGVGDLRDVVLTGANEGYVVSEAGWLWRFEGGVLTREETGARRTFHRLVRTPGPGAGHTLWLVGDWGAVLRKAVP